MQGTSRRGVYVRLFFSKMVRLVFFDNFTSVEGLFAIMAATRVQAHQNGTYVRVDVAVGKPQTQSVQHTGLGMVYLRGVGV